MSSLERDYIHIKNINVTALALTSVFISCYSSEKSICGLFCDCRKRDFKLQANYTSSLTFLFGS